MSGRVDGAAVELAVMAKLKSFQKRTVNHIFDRMYAETDPSRRFLCADEVGLGKTLVAKGLIAKAIKHLQDKGTPRIDVIYICSNAQIASQNISRLNVTGQDDFSLATRITLLPRQLHRLTENEVNFVSFTPGTSFAMSSREGLSEERAVLFRLLEHALERSLATPGFYRTLRGFKREDRFIEQVRWTPPVGSDRTSLDEGLAKAFAGELGRRPELISRLLAMADHFEADDASDDWNARQDLVRDLRITLAHSCVEALEPDLVILDEFQRFKELLDEPDPNDADDIRRLARHLFEQKDVRTLLLSATPYKMYTLRDEQDDNHYDDFLRTTRFLMDGDQQATQAFAEDVRAFRRALLDVRSVDDPALLKRKRTVEQKLQRVMVRTERLAVDPDRNGMLADREMPGLQITPADVRSYATTDAISRELRAGDATDFWKSAPYLLSFMSSYKVKTELQAIEKRGEPHPVANLIGAGASLPMDVIDAYGALDPGNPRLRGLVADTLDRGTWRLLWLPPALPYYTGRGAYADPELAKTTKRLIFSSWNVVPDAISVVMSYEAERRMMRAGGPESATPGHARPRGRLLALNRTDEHAGSMSTLAFVYPSIRLAGELDPLTLARKLGAPERAVDYEEIVGVATAVAEEHLRPFTKRAHGEGPVDQRWYWAAPLLIDHAHKDTRAATVAWLATSAAVRSPGDGDEPEDAGSWALHVQTARMLMEHGLDGLGRVPEDLARNTAILGIGGPGNVALRAVARTHARVLDGGLPLGAQEVRDAALRIAWGFRSLFNTPEATALLRGSSEAEEAYWRMCAEEGAKGNLQAVMDEYLHVLPEWLGLMDRESNVLCERLAKTVQDAVSLQTVSYRPDTVHGEEGQVKVVSRQMRVRYALRLGKDVNDGAKVLQRATGVRDAFNSPFWPFVLTSTSVGQEGLDFHQYCHAIVHWNLPANPVDLEQREGRVHRFKGHAIRKNVVQHHRAAAFSGKTDPWAAMFDHAVKAKASDKAARDIQPFWVYQGDAMIERYAPNLPLSQEVPRLQQLKKSLAVYRLVMGQVRQDDLLAQLGDRFTEAELQELAAKLRVDLSPHRS